MTIRYTKSYKLIKSCLSTSTIVKFVFILQQNIDFLLLEKYVNWKDIYTELLSGLHKSG
jgi:hypothetical protein